MIAEAVVDRLRTIGVLAPIIDPGTEAVWEIIAAACQVLTEPADPGDEPGRPGESPAPPAPESPEADDGAPTSGTEGRRSAGGRSGFVPGGEPGAAGEPLLGGDLLRDFPGVPPEGVAFDYGDATAVPQFGLLGVDGRSGMGAPGSPGTAVALPMAEDSDPIGRPLLLAVVLLALVGAQLVRSWLLRPPGRIKIVIVPR